MPPVTKANAWHPLEIIVHLQFGAPVGCLTADEHVVFVHDFFSCELIVLEHDNAEMPSSSATHLIRVGLAKQMQRLGLNVIVVDGHEPQFYLLAIELAVVIEIAMGEEILAFRLNPVGLVRLVVLRLVPHVADVLVQRNQPVGIPVDVFDGLGNDQILHPGALLGMNEIGELALVQTTIAVLVRLVESVRKTKCSPLPAHSSRSAAIEIRSDHSIRRCLKMRVSWKRRRRKEKNVMSNTSSIRTNGFPH